MSENTGSSKKRKVLSATLAVTMMATMLLSGTLAFFFSASATNEFEGKMLMKEVVAHDDFNQETGDKDIYLENLGESDVYVRVKLTEDFRLNHVNDVTPTSYDPADTAGLPEGAATADPNYTHIESAPISYGQHIHALAAGVASDGTNYNSADDEYFHTNFFSWSMGGNGKTYLSAEDKTAYHALADGQNGVDDPDGVYLGGDQSNVAQDNLGKGTTLKENGGAATAQDYIKENVMPKAQITTVDQYAAMETKDDGTGDTGYWILDNSGVEDGWYYWSRPLKKGHVTGLLLNQVNTSEMLKEGNYNYDYHIHVTYEAVNMVDGGIWLYGNTVDSTLNTVQTTKASDAMVAVLKNDIGLNVEPNTEVVVDKNGNGALPVAPEITDETQIQEIQDGYNALKTDPNPMLTNIIDDFENTGGTTGRLHTASSLI